MLLMILAGTIFYQNLIYEISEEIYISNYVKMKSFYLKFYQTFSWKGPLSDEGKVKNKDQKFETASTPIIWDSFLQQHYLTVKCWITFKRLKFSTMTFPYQCKNTLHRSEYYRTVC